jgi:hypothetical protein
VPTIRIDEDVLEGLKKLAEPFVDTPSSVIRRLLQEKGLVAKEPEAAPRGTSLQKLPSTPSSLELTPQPVYEQFLLVTLEDEFKGRGDKRSVTQAVLERMSKRGMISTADLELVSTGETKGENTISWGRNALKDRGHLSSNSPRGIWELTQEGRAAAKRIQLPIRKPA